MHEDSHRHCMQAERAPGYGRGPCSLLVRRIPTRDGHRVQLLFHAVPETGADLTDAEAHELAEALTRATRPDHDKLRRL